jgi:hypothetical protein
LPLYYILSKKGKILRNFFYKFKPHAEENFFHPCLSLSKAFQTGERFSKKLQHSCHLCLYIVSHFFDPETVFPDIVFLSNIGEKSTLQGDYLMLNV